MVGYTQLAKSLLPAMQEIERVSHVTVSDKPRVTANNHSNQVQEVHLHFPRLRRWPVGLPPPSPTGEPCRWGRTHRPPPKHLCRCHRSAFLMSRQMFEGVQMYSSASCWLMNIFCDKMSYTAVEFSYKNKTKERKLAP